MKSTFDLFNQIQIGYVVIESKKLDEWKRFAVHGVGMHLAEESSSHLAFRIDNHQRRIIVRKGSAEDVIALGIHAQSHDALAEIQKRLAQHAIQVRQGDKENAQMRGVEAFWEITGPKGMSIELYSDALTTNEPLNMLSAGFVTGASGLGHVAITSRKPDKMLAFWQTFFDARISDYIEETIAGVQLDITFTRFNERHHSVAIAAVKGLNIDPVRTNVQHVNLLVSSMTDLVGAFRRLKAMGFEMAHEIGQHPNDKELSFYVLTPSGFEWELGCNALTVKEEDWQIDTYQGISLWGHKPQKAGLFDFLKVNALNLARGAKSLLKAEHSPL